eukprot:10112569-Ditylum_brightwellii.AAC.1
METHVNLPINLLQAFFIEAAPQRLGATAMGVPAKPAAAIEAAAEAVLSPGGAYKTFIQMILDKAAAIRAQAELQEA